MIDVSVIIVNLNTRDLLRECLQSVFQSTLSKEVIVVDNASTDGSAGMVEREFPGARLIRNSRNERFAKPNNDAMRIAKGRYVFLLNSDASLRPLALERLVAYMDGHAFVGLCGPQLLFPDGSIQPSCRGSVSLWSHFCDMFLLDRIFPRSRVFAASEMTFFDHTLERKVDHLMAAAVLVRAEVVKSVGMLDEHLSIYYNDLDWSHRIRKAGWKIVFYPEAQVVHHLGRTARPLISDLAMFREQYENILYYFEKHYGVTGAFLYKVLLFVGFVPRFLYWQGRLLFDRSAGAKAQAEFSARTLRFALPFWKTSGSSPQERHSLS
jgi:N-acetylglucosaminyl-diphospho-decaprenol L-rhamnosyltransferase